MELQKERGNEEKGSKQFVKVSTHCNGLALTDVRQRTGLADGRLNNVALMACIFLLNCLAGQSQTNEIYRVRENQVTALYAAGNVPDARSGFGLRARQAQAGTCP
jgi:hypothetical protein